MLNLFEWRCTHGIQVKHEMKIRVVLNLNIQV